MLRGGMGGAAREVVSKYQDSTMLTIMECPRIMLGTGLNALPYGALQPLLSRQSCGLRGV